MRVHWEFNDSCLEISVAVKGDQTQNVESKHDPAATIEWEITCWREEKASP